LTMIDPVQVQASRKAEDKLKTDLAAMDPASTEAQALDKRIQTLDTFIDSAAATTPAQRAQAEKKVADARAHVDTLKTFHDHATNITRKTDDTQQVEQTVQATTPEEDVIT